ncbi:MAG: lytic transglycosylase domain-containing protein [Thermoleophilia bacterium]|nr:lytic transglycosylase domain-containing protein [Thermoleophilia bacterium]
MTEETDSRRPVAGSELPGGPRSSSAGSKTPASPDGPPPVYVRPSPSPQAAAPRERAAPNVECPAGEGVAEASSEDGQGRPRRSRTARNHLRRNRKRGLLRLAIVAAVIVAAIIVVAVLATRGESADAPIEEQVDPILYAREIAQVAEQYDLDPYLVAAVAKTESGYRAEVVSPVGAVGVMQLMPDTADWVTGLDTWQGDPDPVLTDPADSLELGACYLRHLMDKFDDHTRIALAAYNAGQGTVGNWLAAAGGVEAFDLADIVYPETQEFVRRVEHYRELYTRAYPDTFSGTGGST